jgi:predicted nucleic acid-binding protein
MRILFDTNIVLDVLEERDPYHADAATLFSAVDRGWLTGLLCATTITTIHYIARQTLGAGRTREQLRKILGMFIVAPVTHAIIVDALELGFPDYEDAVLHEAAESADAPHSYALTMSMPRARAATAMSGSRSASR